MSVFPKETLETAATKMLDPGKDFTLPSIKIKRKRSYYRRVSFI